MHGDVKVSGESTVSQELAVVNEVFGHAHEHVLDFNRLHGVSAVDRFMAFSLDAAIHGLQDKTVGEGKILAGLAVGHFRN